MPEPQGDHRGIDAGVQQPDRGGVAQHVHGDALVSEGGTVACGDLHVLGETALERIAAEVLSRAGRE